MCGAALALCARSLKCCSCGEHITQDNTDNTYNTEHKADTVEISVRQLVRVRDELRALFSPLLASVCSEDASHVLPFEREPASFEGAESNALLK